MNNFEKNNNSIVYDDAINLYELFIVLWKRKFLIIFITFLSGLFSIQYSLSLPNIYTSSVLLSPASQQEGGGGMLGKYSGMASLAGISLPSASANKSTEAIARISSFEFFDKFIYPNILIQDLIAVKKWNPQQNTLKYNEEIFDSINGKWVRKVSFPLAVNPSSQEAYKTFKKIMTISQDNKTSFISISIKHQSPFIAKEWVQKIITEINKSMRDDDKNKAIKSINFLNSQFEKINYEEIKKSISSLQQEQMKALMLIEANEDYIFTVLNSPISPELKSEPKRSSIVIFGTFLGFIFSAALVILFHYYKIFFSNNSSKEQI